MKKLSVLSLILCLLSLPGCSTNREGLQNNGSYHKIDMEEAKKMIEEGDVILVDVRTEAEYQQGHIPGAILVSNDIIAKQASVQLTDRSAVYLVYCRSGVRSRQASEQLVDMGYEHVYDIGGIKDWPYETQKGSL